jgi:hypothetical protein
MKLADKYPLLLIEQDAELMMKVEEAAAFAVRKQP